MKRYIIVAALALNGCAIHVVPQPIGGSRGDGIIQTAYTYNAFQRPEVDGMAAHTLVLARCQAWGYAEAVPFGGAIDRCLSRDQYGGCTQHEVQQPWQCTTR